MADWVKHLLLRLMRVPPEPAPPAGSPDSIRVFLAGRNYYRWRILMWGMLQAAIFLSVAVLFLIPPPRRLPPDWVVVLWRVFKITLALGFSVSLVITYFKQRLDYEMRWYIVTDRSLRIRSGIWSVQELTLTFANIQNIRITNGPLQKILGLADLEVDTAGGPAASAGIPSSHTARFAGVGNAEEIRDVITTRLRNYRDAGLGDPDEKHHATPLTAAQVVLAEARALRSVLTSQ